MATTRYMQRTSLGAPSAKDPTKTVAERGAEMGLNQSSGTAGRNKTPAPTREATPDGDPALALVQAHGWALGGHDPAESWQTEPTDPNKNVPVHSSMAKRGPDAGSPGTTNIPKTTVPGKTGDFDTRRQLGLKRTDGE